MTEETKDNEEWAIVELMGHTVTAGLVSEVTKWGKTMMRFDHPGSPKFPRGFTQHINPDALYRVTATTEAIARSIAERTDPRPSVLFNLEYSLQRQLEAGDDLSREDLPEEPDNDFLE